MNKNEWRKLAQLLLVLVLLSSCGGCTSLFYHPDRFQHSRPEDQLIKYENLTYSSKDQTRLHAWYFLRRNQELPSKGLLVLFHGNAQNLSAHIQNVQWLVDHGYDVFCWDYRGYGLSQGVPEPEGIYQDSLATLDYVARLKQERAHPRLIVMGQSLGGAVSLRTMQEFKSKEIIDLLVLDSTFFSYKKVAFKTAASAWLTFVFSPLTYLFFTDRYGPIEEKEKLHFPFPTLVIHGTQDSVVPFELGQDVYQKIRSKKAFWRIENGRHTDVFLHKEFRQQFLKTLVRGL
jgi:alpha-beta hydrolase superfamily lysophospholipase